MEEEKKPRAVATLCAVDDVAVKVKVVAMVAQAVENTNKKPCGHMLPCHILELKTAAS